MSILPSHPHPNGPNKGRAAFIEMFAAIFFSYLIDYEGIMINETSTGTERMEHCHGAVYNLSSLIMCDFVDFSSYIHILISYALSVRVQS